jgi:hypothetical protein
VGTPLKFLLRPDVFPLRLAVWIGPWDAPAVATFLKASGLYDEDRVEPPSHGEAACCYCYGCGSLIWLPEVPNSPEAVGSLAHETFHAVINAGKQLGFTPTDDSDEFYAYLQEWLVREILKRCAKVSTSPA